MKSLHTAAGATGARQRRRRNRVKSIVSTDESVDTMDLTIMNKIFLQNNVSVYSTIF